MRREWVVVLLVLFLFVIMLVNVRKLRPEGAFLSTQAPVALAAGVLVGGLLALGLLRQRETRPGGALLGGVLLAQVTLGILNVWLFLPLPNAVAHNATGALLLSTTVWLLHRARDPNERS